MNDLDRRVMTWLTGRDTGLSSVALVSRLMGIPVASDGFRHDISHPHDPDDLGRCIRALETFPELREKLPEASLMSPEWARLIERWDEIEALYRSDLAENTGYARKCYALMKSILYPAKQTA